MDICPGCRKPFASSKAVSGHRRYCAKYAELPATVLRARRHDLELLEKTQAAADLARRTAAELNGPEDIQGMEVDAPEIEEELPQYRASGLPARRSRLPRRYRDETPPIPLPVVQATDVHLDPLPETLNSDVFQTEPNKYGIYREYYGSIPSYTPDEITSLGDLCNSPAFLHEDMLSYSSLTLPVHNQPNFFAPFPNPTTYRLMNWFSSISNLKSLGELNRLVNDVFLADDFDREDLHGFSATREAARIDSHRDDTSPIFSADDGWIASSVPIYVPAKGFRHASEKEAPVFNVDGLQYRKIVEVVKSAFQEPSAAQFHLSPFREFWTPSESEPTERLYSEIYSSEAMVEEHQKINSQPRNCDLETFVIPILLWSDSTHLTSFGTASLWPTYLFIGNLSKYIRGKPTSFSAHHIAYIPKVTPLISRLELIN
jgi:hypothetical protein